MTCAGGGKFTIICGARRSSWQVFVAVGAEVGVVVDHSTSKSIVYVYGEGVTFEREGTDGFWCS